MDIPTVSAAREKAERFKLSDFNSKARVLSKQAILRELNDSLKVTRARLGAKGNEDAATKKVRPIETKVTRKEESSRIRYRKSGNTPMHKAVNQRSKKTTVAVGSDTKKIAEKSYLTKDYSWNKKGRINEIKIRFLARKYTNIWMKAVYGRVKPSDARNFCEKRLLKRSLVVWQEIWWSSRKGWKLGIRADYHNRFRLWQTCFRAWRLYVTAAKEKKRKLEIALDTDKSRKLLMAWNSWKQYIRLEHDKQSREKAADQFREKALLRKLFSVWSKQHNDKRLDKALQYQALSFWARRVKLKAWQTWINAVLICRHESAVLLAASNYHGTCTKKKFFKLLQDYTHKGREKKKKTEFALEFHEFNLKQRTIKTWYDQLQTVYRHREFADQISTLEWKNVKRRYFRAWLTYMEIRWRKANLIEMSMLHYARNLKRKTLSGLLISVQRRQRKDKLMQKANTFAANKSLNRHWKIWMKRAEDSEELSLYPLTKIARLYYKKKMYSKVLAAFQHHLHHRRKRKLQNGVADEFFKRTFLPKYFRVLMENRLNGRKKTKRIQEANEFRSEILLTKFWFIWISKLEEKQRSATLESMACNLKETNLKQKFINIWRKKTRNRLDHKRKEACADVHYQDQLIRQTFKRLREHAVEETKRRNKEMTAALFNRRKMKTKVLNAWIQYYGKKKLTKLSKSRVSNLYNGRLLRSVLRSWMEIVVLKREIMTDVEQRYRTSCRTALSMAFSVWRTNVTMILQERKKEEKAIQFHRHLMSRKVFDQWKQFTLLHSEHKRQQKESLDNYKSFLDQGRRKRLFIKWRQLAFSEKRQRELTMLADQHYKMTLQKKASVAWQTFMVITYKKKILGRQSRIYFSNSLSRKAFDKWKYQLRLRKEEKQKSKIALWWWSVSLEKKMLSAWITFAKKRRLVKEQTSRALEFRRRYFIQTAIRRWLMYSSQMMEGRQNAAVQRTSEAANALNQRVHKYAMRWYYKTKQRNPRQETKCTKELDAGALRSIPMTGPFLDRDQRPLPGVTGHQRRPRPAPRLPEYLRESFDIDTLKLGDMKSAGVVDDTYPRNERPLPVNRSTTPTAADTSLLALTSDGEETLASSLGKQGQAKVTRMKQKTTPLLFPPAFFVKSTSSKTSEHDGRQEPKQGNGMQRLEGKNSKEDTLKPVDDPLKPFKGRATKTSRKQTDPDRTYMYNTIKTFNSDLREFSLLLADFKLLRQKLASLRSEVEVDENQDETTGTEPWGNVHELAKELERKRGEIVRRKRELGNRSLAIQNCITGTTETFTR